MFVQRLKLLLHDSTERHETSIRTTNLRMVEAQAHQLSANRASRRVVLLRANLSMLDDSLHLETSMRSAALALSALQRMDERVEASVDGFFTRCHESSHSLFLVVGRFHDIRDLMS